jgi:hypothetical protein
MQTKNRLVDGSLALKARQRAAAAAQPKASSSSTGRKIAIIIAILAVIVGVGGGAVWAWKYFDKQAKLARLAELREKMKDPSLSDEDRRAIFTENRELFESMPRDQRRGGGFGRGGFGRGGEDEKMKTFFTAMTPAQQIEQLNKDIDAIMAADAARKARQAASADKSKNAASASNSAGDGKNGSQADKGGDNGQGGPRNAMTDAQKQARKDSFLSSHSPEQRSGWTQNGETRRIYRNMLNNQALTRGITLPAGGGPGGGGFGGGGRRGG